MNTIKVVVCVCVISLCRWWYSSSVSRYVCKKISCRCDWSFCVCENICFGVFRFGGSLCVCVCKVVPEIGDLGPKAERRGGGRRIEEPTRPITGSGSQTRSCLLLRLE